MGKMETQKAGIRRQGELIASLLSKRKQVSLSLKAPSKDKKATIICASLSLQNQQFKGIFINIKKLLIF